MSTALLRVYHRLPAPARSAAAGIRGLYLRSWRYGPETDRLVKEALERDYWQPQRWKAYQEERLRFVLHRAATQVPYYREQWAARRRRGDRVSWEYLRNWPTLEKEPLRANPKAFVADDCDTRRMFSERTSGTTGTPLTLWHSRDTVRRWYGVFEARSRSWYGVSRRDRWAILGGQVVTPVRQRHPPFWVWNAGLRQLYMSAFHLAPDWIPCYLDALRRYQIRYLLGYTSALNSLAQEILRRNEPKLGMQVAICNAEPVLDHQRQAIADAFGCPVRETYGMSEVTAAASECEAGRLHLWPEVGWIEVVVGDQPVERGDAGDLLCTSLLDADMPLIRYRVGDRGALPALDQTCPCGRLLPALASVEGRVDDVLHTSDGRQIGRLDTVFKAGLPIREAQIIQEALNRIRVVYVPAPGFDQRAGRLVTDRLRERLGAVEVSLEPVEQVPRERNGKFRAVICRLQVEQRCPK